MNTENFAARLGIKPQSVRARLSRFGSYYGVIPQTGPNGRHVWDDAAPARLLKNAGERDDEQQRIAP